MIRCHTPPFNNHKTWKALHGDAIASSEAQIYQSFVLKKTAEASCLASPFGNDPNAQFSLVALFDTVTSLFSTAMGLFGI